jgi:hypothetical protein
MLAPGKTFLLRGGGPAVLDQRRGTVVIER